MKKFSCSTSCATCSKTCLPQVQGDVVRASSFLIADCLGLVVVSFSSVAKNIKQKLRSQELWVNVSFVHPENWHSTGLEPASAKQLCCGQCIPGVWCKLDDAITSHALACACEVITAVGVAPRLSCAMILCDAVDLALARPRLWLPGAVKSSMGELKIDTLCHGRRLVFSLETFDSSLGSIWRIWGSEVMPLKCKRLFSIKSWSQIPFPSWSQIGMLIKIPNPQRLAASKIAERKLGCSQGRARPITWQRNWTRGRPEAAKLVSCGHEGEIGWSWQVIVEMAFIYNLCGTTANVIF